jgi:hypothetical protein
MVHMRVSSTTSHHGASWLILVTLALATFSTVMFLLTVAEVPGEALFAVLVGIATTRRVLWRRGVDMSLTGRIPTVPCARTSPARRRLQPRREPGLL